MNPKKLKFLSGPVSFHYYHDLKVNQYHKRIMFLGDMHNNTYACPGCPDDLKDCQIYEVHDYIIDLVEESIEELLLLK